MWEEGGNVGGKRECERKKGMWEERGNVGGRRECGREEGMWEEEGPRQRNM